MPVVSLRRTVEGMSHWASDDEVRDDESERRDEVVDADPAMVKAALKKIMERDAELLKRLAR